MYETLNWNQESVSISRKRYDHCKSALPRILSFMFYKLVGSNIISREYSYISRLLRYCECDSAVVTKCSLFGASRGTMVLNLLIRWPRTSKAQGTLLYYTEPGGPGNIKTTELALSWNEKYSMPF